MRGLLDLPPALRKVIAEKVRAAECAAEERGFAKGKAAAEAELGAGLRMLSCLMPGAAVPPMPVPPPPTAVVAVKPPEATVMLSEESDADPDADPDDTPDVMMGLESAGGPESLADVLDELFGADEWSDLDRRELLRFVMAGVTEAMRAKGRDPEPVLEQLRAMEADKDGFDAAMDGETDQWMSWQARPLRNPRKEFRFAAHNPETGTVKYGQNAIDTMRSHNADKFKFGDGERMPFESGDERTLVEHTEAYRKARESVAALREALASGTPPRPGDLLDYADYLPLLTGAELKGLRSMLAQSLTKRVRAGKTKADRVAGVRDALTRLRDAAAVIVKAVTERAAPDEAAEEQVLLDTEFDPADFAGESDVEMSEWPKGEPKEKGDSGVPVPRSDRPAAGEPVVRAAKALAAPAEPSDRAMRPPSPSGRDTTVKTTRPEGWDGVPYLNDREGVEDLQRHPVFARTRAGMAARSSGDEGAFEAHAAVQSARDAAESGFRVGGRKLPAEAYRAADGSIGYYQSPIRTSRRPEGMPSRDEKTLPDLATVQREVDDHHQRQHDRDTEFLETSVFTPTGGRIKKDAVGRIASYFVTTAKDSGRSPAEVGPSFRAADRFLNGDMSAEDFLWVLNDHGESLDPDDYGDGDDVHMGVGSGGGHTPPEDVRAAARRILKLREEKGDEVRGGTEVGWTRANQLADGGPVSDDVVKRMANFFSRHAKNFAVPPEYKDTPWKDHGWTAFMLWGGAPGRAWSTALADRIRDKGGD